MDSSSLARRAASSSACSGYDQPRIVRRQSPPVGLTAVHDRGQATQRDFQAFVQLQQVWVAILAQISSVRGEELRMDAFERLPVGQRLRLPWLCLGHVQCRLENSLVYNNVRPVGLGKNARNLHRLLGDTADFGSEGGVGHLAEPSNAIGRRQRFTNPYFAVPTILVLLASSA